jgi:predicted DCC family thiol-disulfide oxidoreductase YuxK
MRHIVLYAGSCPACSRVARLVTDASIAGLEARPFDDPQVTASLADAGLGTPDRPALVVIGDTDVQLLTGWAMRRRLAALAGWHRSGTIVRLLAAEWRARLTRSAGLSALSRRGVIGGAAAGILGWAMSSGAAHAATSPAASTPALKAVSPADTARVLQTATAQRAVSTWGAAEVLEVSGGSNPVFMLVHSERDIYTFIDNSPRARQASGPAAVSLGVAPGAGGTIRYYTVSGIALADLTVGGGRATATPAQPTATAEPGIVINKVTLACFAACIGRPGSVACVDSCARCSEASGTLAQRILACVPCVTCAGVNGVNCLYVCNILKK